MLALRRRRSSARSTPSCCSAWAARRSRPRCSGRRSAASVPRPRHDASAARSARSRRSSTSSGRCSSRRPSPARRSRRARTPTTSGSRRRAAQQWVAITDPGSAARGARARAGVPRDLPGRADDRRPLLGAVAVRARARGADGRRPDAACSSARSRWPMRAGSTRATRASSSGSSLGEGWRDGRDKVCLPNPGGFGLWAEQLLAESTGKQGKGLVPAPGESPRRARPAGAGGARQRAVRARAGVLPLGVRDRRRRLDPRHQPVRPAGRAGGQGQDERRCSPRGDEPVVDPEASADELFARREPGDYVASRRSSTRPPRPRRSSPRSRSALARRPAASSRTASARATCTRPASCTRAARTPASSCRSSTTPATSSRSPASRSASRS